MHPNDAEMRWLMHTRRLGSSAEVCPLGDFAMSVAYLAIAADFPHLDWRAQVGRADDKNTDSVEKQSKLLSDLCEFVREHERGPNRNAQNAAEKSLAKRMDNGKRRFPDVPWIDAIIAPAQEHARDEKKKLLMDLRDFVRERSRPPQRRNKNTVEILRERW